MHLIWFEKWRHCICQIIVIINYGQMQKQKLEKRLTYIEPGGGTPLYKPYRYVPNQTVRFLRRFCLKTGIDFAHFGLESGVVLEDTTRVNEPIYRFNSK